MSDSAIVVIILVVVFDPVRRPGILLVGIIINVTAASMHLARSAGIYFGGTKPGLSSRSERNQGLVHVCSLAALGIAMLVTSGISGV